MVYIRTVLWLCVSCRCYLLLRQAGPTMPTQRLTRAMRRGLVSPAPHLRLVSTVCPPFLCRTTTSQVSPVHLLRCDPS